MDSEHGSQLRHPLRICHIFGGSKCCSLLQHFLFCSWQGIQECLHRRFPIAIFPAEQTRFIVFPQPFLPIRLPHLNGFVDFFPNSSCKQCIFLVLSDELLSFTSEGNHFSVILYSILSIRTAPLILGRRSLTFMLPAEISGYFAISEGIANLTE